MARTVLVGSRIRSYRIDKGMRQADLARACDISPSYLNLIEHNRRNIGGGLLLRIADALQVDAGQFSGTTEVQLAQAMEAAAAAFGQVLPEQDRAVELAGRYPGWARLIEAQQRELRRLEQVVERLGDRLTHDPFLSASMHSVLSSVTAIRSASAILANDDDIEPEWEARFHRNIFEDSQRLTEATETLVRYLDSEGDASQDSLPQDELDAWLTEHEWRIEALEDDPTADIASLIAGAEQLHSTAARTIAKGFLERYQKDVEALPLANLHAAVERSVDPIALANSLECDLPLVFRRLSSLRPEDTVHGRVFGLVSCDASGTLTLRKPLPDFAMPRYGAACPFWPLFQALQQPLTPITSTMVVSGREDQSFRVFAYAVKAFPTGLGGPATIEAWMLIEPMLDSAPADLRVGSSCRICAEADCVARREPSIFA